MSRSDASTAAPPLGMRTPAFDLLIAILIALGALAIHAAGGFAALNDARGDNDSLMRLVQIRAWLDGQDWFDLRQYRMGSEDGFPLHWSRLVDLPIAMLIASATGIGLTAGQAEALALVVWPMLLFAAALYLIIDTARGMAGTSAVLPAAVLAAAALHFTGEFSPGAIDHHNIQLVLVLAMLNRLLRADGSFLGGAAAGTCAALSIAIGMETAPYVATAGICIALVYLVEGERSSRLAAGFGAAFFMATALAFVALIDPAQWVRASCDALSSFQLTVAAIGGAGLSAVALARPLDATAVRRAIALGAIGVATLATVIAFFPQCLAGPYAELDPRLRELWLDHVAEAQSLASLLAGKPNMVMSYFVTPMIGLVVLVAAMIRDGADRNRLVLAAILVVAIAVSAWQIRGSTFSIVLAIIPLAMWIGTVRTGAGIARHRWSALLLVGAWLSSTNVLWALAGSFLATAEPRGSGTEEGSSACYGHSDYAALARLQPGTVLAVSNLGASILAHTPHRALAGPYHRNAEGNLVTLDAKMGTAAAALAVTVTHEVDYVAVCPGNSETRFLSSRAPEGFLALLTAGEVPEWLEPVAPSEDGEAIAIYRTRLPANR